MWSLLEMLTGSWEGPGSRLSIFPPSLPCSPGMRSECGPGKENVLNSHLQGGVDVGTVVFCVFCLGALGLTWLLLPPLRGSTLGCCQGFPGLSAASFVLLCNNDVIEDFGTNSKFKFALSRRSLLSELFREINECEGLNECVYESKLY